MKKNFSICNSFIFLLIVKKFSDADIKAECFRIVAPGTMMTRDYRFNRFNIILNDKNVATNVYIA